MLALRIIGTIIMSVLTCVFAMLCVDDEATQGVKYMTVSFALGCIFTLITLWVL